MIGGRNCKGGKTKRTLSLFVSSRRIFSFAGMIGVDMMMYEMSGYNVRARYLASICRINEKAMV